MGSVRFVSRETACPCDIPGQRRLNGFQSISPGEFFHKSLLVSKLRPERAWPLPEDRGACRKLGPSRLSRPAPWRACPRGRRVRPEARLRGESAGCHPGYLFSALTRPVDLYGARAAGGKHYRRARYQSTDPDESIALCTRMTCAVLSRAGWSPSIKRLLSPVAHAPFALARRYLPSVATTPVGVSMTQAEGRRTVKALPSPG